MKGYSKSILILMVLLLSVCDSAFGVATIGGVIVGKDAGSRTITLRLQSGAEKKVVLVPGAKAYRLNQPAILPNFNVGDEVVVKICSPLNEDPLRAEILMDKFSASQYSAFKTTTPTYNKSQAGGGFATSGGAAPIGLPPVSGVYPNAAGGWPNNNTLPSSVGPMGSGPAGGSMTAAPSPWGSPAIGDVLSGGGGGASQTWGTPSPATGTISAQPSFGGESSVMSPDVSSGVTPNQGAWVANPTADKQRVKQVSLQGRVFEVNQNMSSIYVNELGSNKTYTVTIRPDTNIRDIITGSPLTMNQILVNQVVNISGESSMEGIVTAKAIQVQR